jgi:hypothetical protein
MPGVAAENRDGSSGTNRAGPNRFAHDARTAATDAAASAPRSHVDAVLQKVVILHAAPLPPEERRATAPGAASAASTHRCPLTPLFVALPLF